MCSNYAAIAVLAVEARRKAASATDGGAVAGRAAGVGAGRWQLFGGGRRRCPDVYSFAEDLQRHGWENMGRSNHPTS